MSRCFLEWMFSHEFDLGEFLIGPRLGSKVKSFPSTSRKGGIWEMKAREIVEVSLGLASHERPRENRKS